MKNILIFFIVVFCLISCEKENDFKKTTLFLEGFNDNNRGWRSNPDTSIMSSPYNCVRIDNGKLQMYFERSLSYFDCGGGWVEAELSDTSLNHNFNYDKLGVKVVLSDGYLQKLSFRNQDNSGYTLIQSYFQLLVGPFKFDSSSSVDINYWENIDVLRGREYCNEIVLIAERNEVFSNAISRKFVDGQEIIDPNLYFSYNDPTFFDFSFRFHLGNATDVMPMELEMGIESIEIFTWEGDFCIDDV